MKPLLSALALLILLTFGYAFVPKSTVIHLEKGDTQSFTLSYTGFGIRGSGIFGFMPRWIVYSGATGYDAGVTSTTFTSTSSGWTFCEQGEHGRVRSYGFVADSTTIDRGILVPDLKHHLNASYFYSPDGSATGNIRDGNGGYDVITPRFIHHLRMIDGVAVWTKSPSA